MGIYKNRVDSSDFNATFLKFSEKFDPPFSHVLYLEQVS